MTDQRTNDYLTAEIADDGAIVIRGDLDVAGSAALETSLLKRGEASPLVIDLGGVSFIDSSGLRVLLAAHSHATQRGTRVELRNVGPEVLRLLEITKTTGHFTMTSRRRTGPGTGMARCAPDIGTD
jgi:anti-sigma B factor antagonist